MNNYFVILTAILSIVFLCNLLWGSLTCQNAGSISMLYELNNSIHGTLQAIENAGRHHVAILNDTIGKSTIQDQSSVLHSCREAIHKALNTINVDEGTKDIVKLFASTISYEDIDKFRRSEQRGYTIWNETIMVNRMQRYQRCSTESSYFAVCAIQRSSASFIQQWIAHYLIHGASHIVLYDNSSPGSADKQYLEQVTLPFIRAGYVSMHDWVPEDGSLHQLDAYNDCLHRYRHRFQWIGFFDIDEYVILNAPPDNCIPSYLKGLNGYPALAIQWRIMTSRGVFVHDHDKLLLEQYKWQYDDRQSAQWIKSIVNTNMTVAMKTVHIGQYRDNRKAVNSNGYEVPYEWFPVNNRSYKDIEIRHFEGRDWQFAFFEKICGNGKERMKRRDEKAERILRWINGTCCTRIDNIAAHEAILRKFIFDGDQ